MCVSWQRKKYLYCSYLKKINKKIIMKHWSEWISELYRITIPCEFNQLQSQIDDAFYNNKAPYVSIKDGMGCNETTMRRISDALADPKCTVKGLHMYWTPNIMISNNAIRCLCDGLEKNTSVEGLIMMSGLRNEKDAKEVARVLRRNGTLKLLCFQFIGFGYEGAKAIMQSLENNATTCLEIIEFVYGSSMFLSGVSAIADAIRRNRLPHTLTSFVLSNIKLGNAGVKQIYDALCFNTTIKSMEIVRSGMDSRAFEYIDDAYSRGCTCNMDSVCFRYITGFPDAARHLRSLIQRPAIKTFRLDSCTGMNRDVVENIVQGLERASRNSLNCRLESFSITDSNLDPLNISKVVHALKYHVQRIKVLDLSRHHGGISNQGIDTIVEMLRDSRCQLRKLNLDCCNISRRSLVKLFCTLRDKNRTLHTLSLGVVSGGERHNYVGNRCLEKFIHRNRSLIMDTLSKNKIIRDFGHPEFEPIVDKYPRAKRTTLKPTQIIALTHCIHKKKEIHVHPREWKDIEVEVDD